ncbi:MAG: glutamate mutase L [Clostridiales bacterium]|jgi:uncharacterized protein (TIGR01319 family)|nr:glutamate mutase L [Clostridiales bacterium]
MKYILAIDFGRAYTKLCAIDIFDKKVLGRAISRTSPDLDIGYDNALEILHDSIGKIDFDMTLSCTSIVNAVPQSRVEPEPILSCNAVTVAAELLSEGTDSINGIGEIIVIDVGAESSSVYSVADGYAQKPNVMVKGTKLPRSYFTVENGLGFNNAPLSEYIQGMAGKLNFSEALIEEFLDLRDKDPYSLLEAGPDFKRVADEVCRICTNTALINHCGRIEAVYTPFKEAFLQHGKDLTGVKKIIGTGGAIANAKNPEQLISRNLDYTSLRPESPELAVDADNIFYAAGLLAKIDPNAALSIILDGIMI